MGSQLPIWPGNPGNPAISPQTARKKADTRHTENISGEGGGKKPLIN